MMQVPSASLVEACTQLLKQFKEERPENVWPDYPIIEQTEKALEAERERYNKARRSQFGNDSRENYSLSKDIVR